MVNSHHKQAVGISKRNSKCEMFKGSTFTRHCVGRIGPMENRQAVFLPQCPILGETGLRHGNIFYTGRFSYNYLVPDIFSIKCFILKLARSTHYTGNTRFRSLYHRHALSPTVFHEEDQRRRQPPLY